MDEQARQALFQQLSEDAARTMPVDGIMSFQTVALKKRLDASTVAMTRWWAMTPPRWTCPACGREKAHIARRSDTGVLLCKLVEHHDHIREFLLDSFHQHKPKSPNSDEDREGKAFAQRSASMLWAFENTIVCDDCNGADVEAKKRIGAPKHFSFSPAELHHFIIARPNAPHRYDESKLDEAWFHCGPLFDVRSRFASEVAQLAATNPHWFQATESPHRPRAIHTNADGISLDIRTIDGLCGTGLAADPMDDAALTKWRRSKQSFASPKPTASDLARLREFDSREDWEKVPDDWICPGCSRKKVDTVRKNKKGRYFFNLNSSSADPKSAPYRASYMCRDCGLTATGLGKEAFERLNITGGCYSDYVFVREVAHVVNPAPRAPHGIDNDAAEDVVRDIMRRIIDHRQDYELLRWAQALDIDVT